MEQNSGFRADLKEHIEAARGKRLCDLVVKNTFFLDVFSGVWASGDVAVYKGIIVGVGDSYEGKEIVDGKGLYVVPGFIDSHVHIESSMMIPEHFARAVLPRGTTAVIWDPHEIANVKGTEGIDWAVACSQKTPLDIFVMVPSCVPSTPEALGLETGGATLAASDIAPFVGRKGVLGLAEMMNYPGVLNSDPAVMEKLALFAGKMRDGHAPGLRGKDLSAYVLAGISSCHESVQLEEAKEKMCKGLHVLIREGSCAKNAKDMLPLINGQSSSELGLCSDDRNALDIIAEGHIDFIVNLALEEGKDPTQVFRVASYGAAKLYGLKERGALAPGYLADFLLIKQKAPGEWKKGFSVQAVYKNGEHITAARLQVGAINVPFRGKNLNIKKWISKDLEIVRPELSGKQVSIRVIGVQANQIVTQELEHRLAVRQDGVLAPDLAADVLPIAVLERHKATGNIGRAFVKGFKLQRGAIATSINHDCHNVIVVGVSSDMMGKAVERLIAIDGGIVVIDEDGSTELPLEVGGLMSSLPYEDLATRIKRLKEHAHRLGCALSEPFLQLSFLALPVIPKLKITDRGLCDGSSFAVVNVVK